MDEAQFRQIINTLEQGNTMQINAMNADAERRIQLVQKQMTQQRELSERQMTLQRDSDRWSNKEKNQSSK